MQIGLIADTHGYLDPRVIDCFAECDEIWHAGDFGSIDVADRLKAFKPLRGVYGNIDDESIRDAFPEDARFQCEGVDVWITHIAGRPGHYERRVKRELDRHPPGLLVCGHSHILHVEKDSDFAGMQFLNPGAAGHQGFHRTRTLLKCRIERGIVDHLRLIKLGPRGRRPATDLF